MKFSNVKTFKNMNSIIECKKTYTWILKNLEPLEELLSARVRTPIDFKRECLFQRDAGIWTSWGCWTLGNGSIWSGTYKPTIQREICFGLRFSNCSIVPNGIKLDIKIALLTSSADNVAIPSCKPLINAGGCASLASWSENSQLKTGSALLKDAKSSTHLVPSCWSPTKDSSDSEIDTDHSLRVFGLWLEKEEAKINYNSSSSNWHKEYFLI